MTVRPLVMGILNVTPDSFSDGGAYDGLDVAVARGLELRELGADIIDIGGESTRPGAGRVPVEEELARILPVVRDLASSGVRVSVDTMNAETAAQAVAAGASIINDVSGGLADPEMYRTIAGTDATYIASHWRGHSDTMESRASYRNVVAEVRDELTERLAEMIVWGIDLDRVVLDPGLGFAKTADHNWALLGALDSLTDLAPVLVGASRKKFLTQLAGKKNRDAATAVTSALSASAGAWGVRVHDVPATVIALDVWDSWNGRTPR